MRILVDADACPVRRVIEKVAKEYNLPVILFVDTSHPMDCRDAEVVTVDRQRNSVDFALVNRVAPGDIVVTQDYGLAAMVLARGARVLNQDGLEFTAANIESMLFERHMGQEIRRVGGRTRGPSKRVKEQDIKFERSLRQMLNR